MKSRDAVSRWFVLGASGAIGRFLIDELQARGLSTTVADARFAKPLDTQMVRRLANEHEVIITIEEGAIGGFGSHVAQLLAEEGVFDAGLKYRSMVLPDIFIDQASPEAMYRVAGMDAGQIRKQDPGLLLFTLYTAVIGSLTEASVLSAFVGADDARTSLKRREEEVVAFVRAALRPPEA